jgi:hypothetical protein
VKIIPFLKVFEIPKDFFQKVLWWGAGAKPRRVSPPINQNLKKSVKRQAQGPPLEGLVLEFLFLC